MNAAAHRRARMLRAVVASAVVLTLAACATAPRETGTPTPSSETPTPTVSLPPGTIGDEFDGPAGAAPSSDVWSVQEGGGGWGNNELQIYTTDAVRLDGEGHLVIEAAIPRDGGTPTSGRLTTQGRFSFTYGTLTARIRLPDGTGLLPAFWLLGDSLTTVGWPASGEIDVVETPFSTGKSVHSVHGPTTSAEAWKREASVAHETPLSSDFHEYSVVKSPGGVRILLDGELVYEVTSADLGPTAVWVFDGPFHVLFSLAVGGNWPGSPDATTPETAQMIIDWVRFTPLNASP